MSTLFAPTPLPYHASVLFWCTFAGVMLVAAVLNRRGEPRSVTVWICVGYLAGLFYGRGDRGGLVGSIVGLVLGLASARLSERRR